jgi:hypothetical protein
VNLRRYAVLALATSACALALASCGKSTSVTAATPALDPAPPSAPTTLSSTYVSAMGYDYLYWNQSTSPSTTGYEIWESATQGGTAVRIASAGAGSNFVVLPLVDSDCTRFYQVRARGAGGTFSAFSAAVAIDRHVIVSESGAGANGGGGAGYRMAD